MVAAGGEGGTDRAGAVGPGDAHAGRGGGADGKEFLVAPGTVDPRPAMLELDAAIPKDWTVVSGGESRSTSGMSL